MLRNIIKDLLTLLVINSFIIKSLDIFFVKMFITFRTANIFLMLKETFKRR